ncbi:MAG: helix-turn-helix domain-containing protein [Rhizobiaceae bacterium]|nr:helix-turn-helix domain-containing protein [Rhizobiaceae bacterium]
MEHITESFYTLPSAAKALGIKVHSLRRAVKVGLIPSYRPFGKRIYVRLSEVVSYVKAHQQTCAAITNEPNHPVNGSNPIEYLTPPDLFTWAENQKGKGGAS